MVSVESTKKELLGIGLIAGERKGVLAEAIYSISQRFGFPQETEDLWVPSTVHRMVSRSG
jgi:hypothetical protein